MVLREDDLPSVLDVVFEHANGGEHSEAMDGFLAAVSPGLGKREVSTLIKEKILAVQEEKTQNSPVFKSFCQTLLMVITKNSSLLQNRG